MSTTDSLVVTSIAAPNTVLRSLAEGCVRHGLRFYVIGDQRSPAEFHLDGCEFYSPQRQLATGFSFAQKCPWRHYARKNVGYLLAIASGARTIVETDDDNMPLPPFWADRQRRRNVPFLSRSGWVNVYGYFSDTQIWPRGFPLHLLNQPLEPFHSLATAQVDSPIQQGLADGNPDVDAVYRLVLPLPLRFIENRVVALGKGAWSPFNSQNTTWWPDAFPLLYLPAHCSFRMTDIWRSFIAQRIGWENGWYVSFESSTVWQDRNDHDLMRDFADEIPGYLHNARIVDSLAALSLLPGLEAIPDNLRACYQAMIGLGCVAAQEMELLEAWLNDLKQVTPALNKS